MVETPGTETLEAILQHIRPAVRRERPYLVGSVPDVKVKLNQNESPYDLPPPLKRALLETFFEIPFNRYPTEQPGRLTQALGAYLDHDPAGVLVGNGSNELTYTLGLSMVEAGAKVVLPRPMFALYETMVRLYGGTVIGIPPHDDLRFDTDAIVAAVRQHRPALTVLTTPNNPTGLALPLSEVEAVVQAASGFVVVDEAYVEFNEEESARRLAARYPNVLLLRTLSKAFGLAGLRIGYLFGHPAVIQELLKARLPFMIDRFSEAVALALLERPALVQEQVALMKAESRRLTDALAALPGVTVVPSQTNFMLFKTPLEPTALMARLAKSGVLVRNMGGYPELRGYLRVNAGTPDENKVFMAALKEALQTQG